MKICALEIDIKRLIITVYEKNNDGDYINHTGKFTSITLNDDLNHHEILNFTSTLHTHFDSLNLDRIVILRRNSKGQYSSSPISFKIEGLIQTYSAIEIEFVPPQTLTTYYKKNEFPLKEKHKYQIPSLQLAYYILNK
ncbi:MAG: DUF3010 family protein [Flavobacterium sp.]